MNLLEIKELSKSFCKKKRVRDILKSLNAEFRGGEVEPYKYDQLLEFDPKYMSGFFGEVYNEEPSAFEPRAKLKAAESAKILIKDSISGYASVSAKSENISMENGRTDYALFPVWLYVYKYKDEIFRFYVNGQTGKVVGKTPISTKKVWAYGLSMAAILFFGLKLLWMILEVM